jgi:hypothetical protein
MTSSNCGIKALIVFDPNRKPDNSHRIGLCEEEALAEARLLYYYATCHVDQSERRSQSSLIQGVVEFSTFVNQTEPDKSSPLSIETDQLLYLVKEIESQIFISIIFERNRISERNSKIILSRFIQYYHLFHGSLVKQLASGYSLSVTMDDFVPSFIASEGTCGKLTCSAIRYAPVEAHTLVAVHSLGLELLTEFQNIISDFSILYRGFLVSSSIDPHKLAPLYSYVALNSATGEVSNTKLLRPPYGRIGTAAIALGGGSSAFGRCNFFDADNSSHGFLFGPTGSGEAVFCPPIYMMEATEPKYLVAYMINGVMVLVLAKESPEFTFCKRFEAYLTDNNEFNQETLSLLRSDFSRGATSKDERFDFVYLNNETKSLFQFDSSGSENKLKRGNSIFSSSRLLTPFGSRIFSDKSEGEGGQSEDQLTGKIDQLVEEHPEIANIAVKASSNDTWKVFIRRGQEREMRFDFKDSKIPLWRVNSDISHFLKVRFDSIVL